MYVEDDSLPYVYHYVHKSQRGELLLEEFLARKLCEKLRGRIVEMNGGLFYRQFSLADDMRSLQQAKFKKSNRPSFILQPDGADLSESFFRRNPDSQWKNSKSQEMSDVEWLKFDLDKTLEDPLKILVLPEFDSRFGFSSSFAYQINRFVEEWMDLQ